MFPISMKLINRTAMADWLGVGRKDVPVNADLADADLKKLGLELGDYGVYDNHVFRAVKTRVAITGRGFLVKSYMNNAGRTGLADATSTKDILVTTDTLVAGDLKGGVAMLDAGTGIGDIRYIFNNGAQAALSKVTVAKRVGHLNLASTKNADIFSAQPDGTTGYNLHADWEVEMSTAGTDCVQGTAVGAVTNNQSTLIYVAGPYCPIFLIGNNAGKNGVAGSYVIPSGTTGKAEGVTQAGILAVESAFWFAQIYSAYTGAGAVRYGRVYGKFACGGIRNIYDF